MVNPLLSRIATRIQNLSIVKKMAIGYFIIVFLPLISFGLYLYNQSDERVLDQYALDREEKIRQFLSNLKVSTFQIESVYALLQNNSNTVDYLSGAYATDYEQANNFLRYIRPLFSYIYSSNNLVDSVKIYTSKQNDMIFRTEFADISEFPYAESVDSLPLGYGKWMAFDDSKRKPDINLHYFRKIGNRTYLKEIGILDISVNSGIINPLLTSMGESGNNFYVQNASGQEIYKAEASPVNEEAKNALLRATSQREPYHAYEKVDGHQMLVQSFVFDELQMKFVVLGRIDDAIRGINRSNYELLLTLSALLLVLSGLYYLIALSMTRRILKLSRHMRQVNDDYFPLYRGEIWNDEVGQLTTSYNRMIQKIDELVNTVHRSEMMRKEAAYQMLQAQIKPHFLYNTLESIRMIAEANDDPDAAHMSYSLGKLLRYSLSSIKEETTLREEVDIVREYVHIQQVRLGQRLAVSIEFPAAVESFVCPRFMLQPLVENSIVHGIASVRRRCELTIRLHEDESFVYIDITDTGSGIETGRLQTIQRILSGTQEAGYSPEHGHGHGIFNVNERVQMFYGKSSGIEIESVHGQGTHCTLRLEKERVS